MLGVIYYVKDAGINFYDNFKQKQQHPGKKNTSIKKLSRINMLFSNVIPSHFHLFKLAIKPTINHLLFILKQHREEKDQRNNLPASHV